MWLTDWLISLSAPDCSREAPTIAVTLRSISPTREDISCNAVPVLPTNETPFFTCSPDVWISVLISLGSLSRALRQFPDFLRDDGKALSCFSGAGRLDAGVQRQQVGLEGDLVDDADDAGDLLR